MHQFIKLMAFTLSLFVIAESVAQDQMYSICPLKIGEQIPDAVVMNSDGEVINLLDIFDEKPTVAIFYRGAWCGYCTKHLAELNDIKSEVEALGFQIIGITPDQSTKIKEAQQDEANEIPVYSDFNFEATSAFGLGWKVDDDLFEKYKTEYQLDLEEWSGADHHRLPVPSIYLVRDNVVEFQYVNPNYKKRMSPAVLIAVLQNL